MRKYTFRVGICAAAVLVGTAWAEPERAGRPLRLELDLVDGSHIIGTTSIESVPVQTTYAKMDIPLKQILTIKMGDDHETAALDLCNGDKLKGVVTLEPLELTTLFSSVKVGIEHVQKIVVSTGEGLPATLKRGLVLHYSFDRDEGGTVTDKSGKNHDGKVNGAQWTAKGKRGGACQFDGSSDSITVPGYKGILGNAPWMVSFWFRRSNDNAAQQLFVGWGGWGNGRGAIVEILLSDGELYEHYGALDYHTGRFVRDNDWHHYALVKGETTQQRYLDGVSLNDTTSFTLAVGTTSDVTIGKRQVGSELYFGGLLDEICIYDRALSADEVKMLYEARK